MLTWRYTKFEHSKEVFVETNMWWHDVLWRLQHVKDHRSLK
jgi:hypothetical protein